jgi:hypothetical protein
MAGVGAKRFGFGALAAAMTIAWIGGRVEQRAPGTVTAEVTNVANVAGQTGAGVLNAGKLAAQSSGLGDVLTVPTTPAEAGGQIGGVAGEGAGQ